MTLAETENLNNVFKHEYHHHVEEEHEHTHEGNHHHNRSLIRQHTAAVEDAVALTTFLSRRTLGKSRDGFSEGRDH